MKNDYLAKKEELKKYKLNSLAYTLIDNDTLKISIENLDTDDYEKFINYINDIVKKFEKDFNILEYKETYLSIILKDKQLDSFKDYVRVITKNFIENIYLIYDDFKNIFINHSILKKDNYTGEEIDVIYNFAKSIILSNNEKKYQLFYIFESYKNIVKDLINDGLEEKAALETIHRDYKLHYEILLKNIK